MIEFGFIYPVFYFVGRAFYIHHSQRALPCFDPLLRLAICIIHSVKRFKDSAVGR